jgi:hypothetical protein
VGVEGSRPEARAEEGPLTTVLYPKFDVGREGCDRPRSGSSEDRHTMGPSLSRLWLRGQQAFLASMFAGEPATTPEGLVLHCVRCRLVIGPTSGLADPEGLANGESRGRVGPTFRQR